MSESADLERLTQLLSDKKMTVATAESCTGGLLAAALTALPGSSRYFLGSVVAYADAVKSDVLGVRHETLEKHGAVSEACVGEMLSGILRLTHADVAIAISGIAGPAGGTAEKPVGTVFIGVQFGLEASVQRHQFAGDRESIRAQAVEEGIGLVLTRMTGVSRL